MDYSHKTLTGAILQTIAYSDVFDYPLTMREIHRYLTGIEVSVGELEQILDFGGPFVKTGTFFSLSGRQEIASIRMQREARSRELLPHALRFGRVLGSLPFVRMVALTGSLAVMNVSANADFDYMLVTADGRVWTARAFALLFNRLVKRFGHTLCPNLIVSEKALEWPLHDLYSARELCQMIPVTGRHVYQKLLQVNTWAKEFLPNAFAETGPLPAFVHDHGVALQKVLELPLRGKLGSHFEQWEMHRKTTRFSHQEGFGEETIFSAEICQGNFHHHRKRTQDAFEARMCALTTASGSEMKMLQTPSIPIGAHK